MLFAISLLFVIDSTIVLIFARCTNDYSLPPLRLLHNSCVPFGLLMFVANQEEKCSGCEYSVV